MKKRNNFLLNELQLAEFRRSEDPTGGDGGGTTQSTKAKDFIMISGSESCPECEYGYAELLLSGPGGLQGKPIHHEDIPERVIMINEVPGPKDNWSMALTLNNGTVEDTIKVKSIAENYDALREKKGAEFKIVKEEEGVFFSIQLSEHAYETYMYYNQKEETLLTSYTHIDTYDEFRVSFLALATK